MSDHTQQEIDQISINALRFLAVDAVEKAKSGHPAHHWAARRSPTCFTRS